ncbi:amino acid transporter AVT1H [Neltuma alba]|uniref:amino acid transporter AVT1H n=1 Tax=Neltuma alba TaxID=207710 RepID=UPI0010A39250|nr:amino acid transporter AVT1H [Prosopis alba]
MLKSVEESLTKKKNKKKNQSASDESANGVEWTKCNVCLELSNPQYCNCGVHAIIEDANAADAEPNCSFAHAVINMVGMLTGLGQLSASYAVEEGGWACAVIFLIGLAITCAYSCLLLGKCMDKNPKLRSYADIGEEAFGRKGRMVASTLIYTEIFMALVSYTISLHDNLFTVFMGSHYLKHLRLPKLLSPSQLLTVLAVLIAMPSLWLRDLSSISFLSSAGVLMSLIIFSSVVATPIFGGVKVNHRIPVLQIHNVPSASGLFIYSFGGHVVFPDLYKSMKDPSKFTKVIIVSFSIATLLFTTLGFMGAKMFGPQVKSQITLSMPENFIGTKIAVWATVITPMTKYALEFAPLAIQLQHRLPSSMRNRSRMMIRSTVGSVLLLVILALALSVPYFEDVLCLTGSLLTVFISLIFPCAFYTKICWGQMSNTVLAFNSCLIALGLVLGVMGTISSSSSLLSNLQPHH